MIRRVVMFVVLMASVTGGAAANAAAQAVPRTAAPAAAPALQSRDLAVFSPTRAYAMSADGKAAQARLGALEARKAGEIETRRKALDAQRADLAQSGAVLSDTARAQRTQAIQRFEVDLERFIQDAQSEVMGVQRGLENAFLAKLRPALEGVIKEHALKLVLNEDAGHVAWADPSLDITPAVVVALEASVTK
jgi:Skp family chaperone for outer membrane proteins